MIINLYVYFASFHNHLMNNTDVQNVLDINDQLIIATNEIRLSKYKNKHNHYIAPLGTMWNFTILSVFLNELKKFKVDTSNSCRIVKASKSPQYFFF